MLFSLLHYSKKYLQHPIFLNLAAELKELHQYTNHSYNITVFKSLSILFQETPHEYALSVHYRWWREQFITAGRYLHFMSGFSQLLRSWGSTNTLSSDVIVWWEFIARCSTRPNVHRSQGNCGTVNLDNSKISVEVADSVRSADLYEIYAKKTLISVNI